MGSEPAGSRDTEHSTSFFSLCPLIKPLVTLLEIWERPQCFPSGTLPHRPLLRHNAPWPFHPKGAVWEGQQFKLRVLVLAPMTASQREVTGGC